MLDRRLQVLIDEPRYERLRRAAQLRGVAVGELVREAIDRTIGDDPGGRRSALTRVLDAAAMPVPDDPHELKRELQAARVARIAHADS